MRLDRFIWQDGDFEWLEEEVTEGGPGSGNFGHSGRPGRVGGSGSGGGGSPVPKTESEKLLKSNMEQMEGLMSKNRPEGAKDMRSGYRLVMEDGRFYTPQERLEGIKKGPDKGCYMNAGRLALSNGEYTYVEGFAFSKNLEGLPFAHAWVVDKKGNVVDPTWPKAGTAYYGIPFKTEYLNKTIMQNKYWGLIPEYPQSNRDLEIFKGGFPKGAVKK